jgi:hypothetical protein
MKPNPQFRNQEKAFWACVRSLSQDLGYTVKRQDRIKVPTVAEMRGGFLDLELNADAIADERGRATELGKTLQAYFSYQGARAGIGSAEKPHACS